jgi:hypothetical protein
MLLQHVFSSAKKPIESTESIPLGDYDLNTFAILLIVEVAVITTSSESTILLLRVSTLCIREAEEAGSARVLHALCEGLVSPNFDVSDGASRTTHSLLEVSLGELWHWVLSFNILVHGILALGLTLLGALNINRDALLDGELDGTLSDKAKIGTGEAVGVLGNDVEVDVRRNGSLAELSLENAHTGSLVGKWDVDESVETSGTAESIVELLGTVSSTDNEDVLLRRHAIHF